MKVNEDNYIVVQGWMRTDLKLKGNDLFVYAIIYGFSQTENQRFTGSLQYLADWCGATKQGIQKNLKNLIDLGLINKYEYERNGMKFCEYSCILCNSVAYPVQLSCTNNIDNTIEDIDNTISINTNSSGLHNTFSFGTKQEKPKKDNLYSKCVALVTEFTDDEILRSYLTEFLKRCLANSKESGVPFYTNTFRGKLNKLKTLSEDNYVQRDIVMQTLNNGWNGFYELKKDKVYNRDVSSEFGVVKSVTYTEEEKQQQENWRREMERNGKQVKF